MAVKLFITSCALWAFTGNSVWPWCKSMCARFSLQRTQFPINTDFAMQLWQLDTSHIFAAPHPARRSGACESCYYSETFPNHGVNFMISAIRYEAFSPTQRGGHTEGFADYLNEDVSLWWLTSSGKTAIEERWLPQSASNRTWPGSMTGSPATVRCCRSCLCLRKSCETTCEGYTL